MYRKNKEFRPFKRPFIQINNAQAMGRGKTPKQLRCWRAIVCAHRNGCIDALWLKPLQYAPINQV
jgi:hypothetical protein